MVWRCLSFVVVGVIVRGLCVGVFSFLFGFDGL